MYDLIRGAEREIQESRDGYRGNEVAVGQSVAGIVNVVQGEAGQVEVLLWADDVDIFPVVYYFADERHILETEERNLAL